MSLKPITPAQRHALAIVDALELFVARVGVYDLGTLKMAQQHLQEQMVLAVHEDPERAFLEAAIEYLAFCGESK